MPGRKRYDALNGAVQNVQLPLFVQKDGKFNVDPDFGSGGWGSLKSAADDVVASAQDLNDHPNLHDSHQAIAGDVLTAANAFQGMVMTSYNEWRAAPEGEDVKQTEAMVGMGSTLQFLRSKLGEFDQDKLDAMTTMFGS